MSGRPRHMDAARHRYCALNIEDLRCYGCAFSAPNDAWPGTPSGQAPCQFCVRNPLHVQNLDDEHTWFDGSEPISVPMDAYSTHDMRMQYGVWLTEANDAGRTLLENLMRTRGLLSGEDD